jgi:hypothetical protein
MPSEIYEDKKMVPQVRLLAHFLNPDHGVFTVHHSTLDKNQLDSINEIIENLIQRAKMRFIF